MGSSQTVRCCGVSWSAITPKACPRGWSRRKSCFTLPRWSCTRFEASACLCWHVQPHAVIGGYHAIGQAVPQHLVVQVGMHVGDDGTLRLETIDPGQRIADAEVAGMAGIAQAVDDPEIEIFKE